MRRFKFTERQGIIFLMISCFVFLTGVLCNSMVRGFNGGYMPVFLPGDPPGVLDYVHKVADANTRIPALADWIHLHGQIYSPGDLLFYLGSWMSVVAVTFGILIVLRERKKHESQLEVARGFVSRPAIRSGNVGG